MKKGKIFLLHYAGGNCFSFRFLFPYLNEFDILPLELPGRGLRCKEKLLENISSAADDYYGQVLRSLQQGPPSSFIIYGHSMGALLGFHVTALLEKIGRRPVSLVVSGNCGPGVKEDKKLYLLPDNEFMQAVIKLGGIPEEVAGNKELVEFFVPILRADFRLLETPEGAECFRAIDTPIRAIMGDREENVQKIENWKKYTRGRFECTILEGDHFFIRPHVEQIAGVIRKSYGPDHSLHPPDRIAD